MAYVIDQTRCINCSWCRRECPTDTIHYFDQENRKHQIDPQVLHRLRHLRAGLPDELHHPPAGGRAHAEQLAIGKDRARTWARNRRKLKLGFRAYAESQVLRIVNR